MPVKPQRAVIVLPMDPHPHKRRGTTPLGFIRFRFLRFLGTGVLNTAFGYGIFCLGLALGLGAGQALVLQFTLGIPFNYAVHGRFVFGQSGYGRLPAYAAIYFGLFALNLVALDALVVLLPAALAQAALILPMAALSFLLLSKLLHRRPP